MLEETIDVDTAPATALSRKATLLIAEVLQMSNRVLPLTLAAQIQVGFGVVRSNALIDILARHFLECSTWRLTISRVSTE